MRKFSPRATHARRFFHRLVTGFPLVLMALCFSLSSQAQPVPPDLQLLPAGGNLPSGTVGVPYSQKFTPSGGEPPYELANISFALPDLPDGLTFDPDTLARTPTFDGFTLSGTPTRPGTYVFDLVLSGDATKFPTPKLYTFTLIIQPRAHTPEGIPVLSTGTLATLTLVLGIVAFGAARNLTRRKA